MQLSYASTKKVYREIAPAIDCIFLCGLESFITKSLQDIKSYKQIIHICTVCSNRQASQKHAV